MCLGSHQTQTHTVWGFGGDTRWSRRLQAVSLGAVGVREGYNVSVSSLTLANFHDITFSLNTELLLTLLNIFYTHLEHLLTYTHARALIRISLSSEWLLTKIVNGERASYSAPKFARMQERTRSQMLEDLVMNLSNHAETGQIPKPYRRGSWRPIGEDEYNKMLHARVLAQGAATPQSSSVGVDVCCVNLGSKHSM